ncbi:hypothetical protein LAZ29_03240 [Cereibacter sphaeroides]|uniref:hypothetical protein n=1 Tax=Cereibacter sphaeroides TaxID=1063 RepID=UPI001F405D77|nr:hypothetical protein [Cereibacter sphaeroides]MCE6949938.1 hypothetical protein [Cereibacter sphaeroides]
MRLPVFLFGWIIAIVATGFAAAWQGMDWETGLLLIVAVSCSAQFLYIGYVILLASRIQPHHAGSDTRDDRAFEPAIGMMMSPANERQSLQMRRMKDR